VLLSGLPLTTQAQSLTPEQIRQIDQQTNISRERMPGLLPTKPNVDLRILAPEQSAVAKSVDEIDFDFNGVEIEGLSTFSKATAEALFAPLLNKKVGLSAIRDAASALEAKYRERGFFLVRVFIPPQQVNAGIFKVQVIEGFVSQVFVEGPNSAVNDVVEAYARPLALVRPLDLSSLERILLLINDIPGISGSAVLRPGAELGASELVIAVAPLANSHVGLLSNTGSKTTGPYSLGYAGTFQQPLNSKGQLSVGLTTTGTPENNFNGVRSINARYSEALGSRGLIFSFGGSRSLAKPGDYLESLQIVSNAYSISPRLRYPLQRSRVSSVYLDAGLAVNSNETTVGGEMLTRDRTSVSDLAASWVLNGWLGGTQTLGFGLSRGLKIMGAMDKDAALPSVAGFEPEFLKYTMTFQRLQPLPKNFSLRMQAMGQYTRDKLLSGEQIVFGASTIGRGFAPAIITGDKGLGGMLELRYDLNAGALRWLSSPQVYFSRDWAGTQTVATAAAAASKASLSSDALGLRFTLNKLTLVDLRVAHALQKIDTHDPQRNNKIYAEIITQF
jgi:hemolysin activation/secretion protein